MLIASRALGVSNKKTTFFFNKIAPIASREAPTSESNSRGDVRGGLPARVDGVRHAPRGVRRPGRHEAEEPRAEAPQGTAARVEIKKYEYRFEKMWS